MISQVDFDKIQFQSHGFIEPLPERVAQRVPPGCKPTNDYLELRGAISNLLHDVKESRRGSTITNLLTYDCNIPIPTYKKYISGNGRPSRSFIGKLAVGLGLSVDQANELFRLHSGVLNLTNDADFVTYHALVDRDSIDVYEAELKRFLGYQEKMV